MMIPIKESIYSYQNGANVALEGIEMVYGIEAISFILSLYIALYFPLFIIWILLLFASIFNRQKHRRWRENEKNRS